jgi:hypothetical protein
VFDERWTEATNRPVATPWTTKQAQRSVLAVVHNVTSATRLFDVLSVLAVDERVEVVFTCTGSSAFDPGTQEFLAKRQVAVVEWAKATEIRFDMAISTSYGGSLEMLNAPLVVLPHGMGYNKYSPETGNRKPETGNRKPETGNRKPVFGLSEQWLLHDGTLIPSSIVLSHTEQLDRLEKSCPAAVPAAVVAGDPAFDRMLVSAPLRQTFREAMGVRQGQKLIVVSSTWGVDSLYGRVPDLVRGLRAQLPLDDYRIAIALHPNTWSWHSPWQIRMWLDDHARSGVIVLPPEEGWQAALVAADLVIGDHGSVTFYGAALGLPVLLAAVAEDAVDPESAVGRFIVKADRLDLRRPYLDQIDHAMRTSPSAEVAEIGDLVSSVPGKSAALLRAEFYRWLRLPEPDTEAYFHAAPIPRLRTRAVGQQWVRAQLIDSTDPLRANVTRYVHSRQTVPADSHLVISTDTPRADLLEAAEIVVHDEPGDAETWIAAMFRALPGAVLATMAVVPGVWLVGDRDGLLLEFSCPPESGRVWASVAYAWLEAGRGLGTFPASAAVTIGLAEWCAEVRQVKPASR